MAKVLFGDFAILKYKTIIESLEKDNVVGEGVTDPQKFLDRVSQEHYDVAVVNLLLGGIGPFEMIKNVRQASRNQDLKIIVVSRQVHKMNIQNTIRAGANDFVADPFENDDMLHRILYHLSPKRTIAPASLEVGGSAEGVSNRNSMTLLLEAAELLSRTDRGREHSAFLKILQNVASFVGSNRSSLIIVENESNTGLVLASSDDPNFYDFPIALSKYPEILHVMHSGSFVLIEDTARNSLTQRISEKVKSIQIGSLMVFPVFFQNEITGVLTIRRQQAREIPSMDVLRVLQAVANTMAAHANVKALLRKIYKEYATKTGT
jgi:CheY-like chemotaxis protein